MIAALRSGEVETWFAENAIPRLSPSIQKAAELRIYDRLV
jgi:hypothetical protein